MTLDSRSRCGISAYFFFYHGALGLIYAFVPIFLKKLGFSYTQLGWLAFTAALSGASVQMGIGYLSDHLRMRRPPIVLAMVILAVIYPLFLILKGYGVLSVVLYAFSGIMMWSSTTLITALVGDLSGPDNRSFVFASMRVFGSIGWVLALIFAAIFPVMVKNTGIFFSIISAFFALAGISVLLSRDALAQHVEKPPLRDAARALVGSRNMVLFLLSYLIFMVSLSSLNNFLPLFIKHGLGLSELTANRWVPTAFIVSAVCEMPFMLWLSRTSDRVGRKPLLLLSFMTLPIRIFVLSRATSPGMAVATQALHGTSWGVMMVVSVAFMAESVPTHLRASGQALLTMITAGASGLWAVEAGRLADRYGLAHMLLVVSIAALGALLVGLFLQEPSSIEMPARVTVPAAKAADQES